MTNEMKREIAERIMTKVRLEELSIEDLEIFNENKRFNPFHSERVGMEQMLKLMGIPFEYEIDWRNNYAITAITIDGIKVNKIA